MRLANESTSAEIRKHAKQVYIDCARRKGERRFNIRVGDVHKELRLHGRVPQVCSALKSRKFLEENSLDLVAESGPPSGQSTTVEYTYEFREPHRGQGSPPSPHPLFALRGLFREVYASFGGGEEYLKNERSNFGSREDTVPE
jgi:hypothetical protein